ncbi:MAG: SRPBCC family protein [Gemmatimonadaceae bacterium]|nr:SRPBCC family protein [Gemmatimonadaceae bacterium]
MKHSGNLTVTTPSDREIAMARVFDAPRRLVFDAYTTCEYLKRWLGAFDTWSLDECSIDLRIGGAYRWHWTQATDGMVLGMRGVYLELTIGERIVCTELFDDAWYEGEAICTITFVESGGKTTLTQTVRYATKEARDGVLESGMTGGVTASFDALAELLASSSTNTNT